MEIKIGAHEIGENKPTYFIADISANHDGDLERAKMLIHLAKEAGVDAAKFQNFRASQIVSDYGFRSMQGQVSHQSNWKKTVFEVYQDASLPFEWTPILKDECDQAGIDYFSSPYDFEAIDMLDAYVPAYKIGSGDITWMEALERMARKGKPVILATGASEIGEVQRAVHCITQVNPAACADAVQYELHSQPGKLQPYPPAGPEHLPGHVPECDPGAIGSHARACHRTGCCSPGSARDRKTFYG
jgi:sialic acid synthase SpsE